jgi:hypothetical protein
MHPPISISRQDWLILPQIYFAQATDAKPISQETIVQLRYDDTHLHVAFECRQNPFWHQNGYTTHNSDMWNQEVFELFITTQLDNINRYFEFEINPNNAIWVGRIHNPTGEGLVPADTQMIAYEDAQIKHRVSTKDDVWSGEFSIPFDIIGSKQQEYRFNFYRIISTKSHTDKAWIGSPDDCLYACLNSPVSGNVPMFHKTKAFGKMILV